MKVAMYYSNSDVRLQEMPRPEIGSKELLIKVMASGICGSDVMEWYRKRQAPLVPGHEVSGEIAEAGKDVTGFSKGDRVVAIHKVPCNTCPQCLGGHHTSCDTTRSTKFHPGGFSEYIRVPEINADRGVFRLPDALSYGEGTFFEPLSCAVRAQGMMDVRPGESVLVMGCGVAGLLNIRLAISRGAGKVFATDVSGYRLGLAEKSGAVPIRADSDVPGKVRELNGGCLADNVIVCTGAKQAAEQSFRSVERGGTVMLFAVPRPDEEVSLPLSDFWTSEIRVMASYYTSPRDICTAIKLIESGRVKVSDLITHRLPLRVKVSDLITHRLPLDRTGEGFRLVADAGESMKVIIEPHGPEN
jgi:L-iditol 2-dehydrogenase